MNYSIEYYKEKDTDPMVFLQRFRCTTEPIGGGTEQDEEGELVSCDAAVAAIEIAKKQLGWHPASEPPKEGDEVMVITTGGISASRAIYTNGIYCSVVVGKKAYYPSVEWWCYPPRKEEG